MMAFVNAQKAFMNTKHPQFLDSVRKLQEEDAIFGQIAFAILPASGSSGINGGLRGDFEFPRVQHKGKVTLLPQEVEANLEIDGQLLTFETTELTDSDSDSDSTSSGKSFQLDRSIHVCKSFIEGDNRRFVLQKRDGECLLEFVVQPVNVYSWTQAFTRIGILLRNDNSLSMVARPNPRNFDREVKSDKVIKDRTSIMVQMVSKYMEVVHASMLDMAPKYICMSLLKATLNYSQKYLAGDILSMGITEEEIETLMDTSAEDKRRIDQLKATKRATEEALEIISDMSD